MDRFYKGEDEKSILIVVTSIKNLKTIKYHKF